MDRNACIPIRIMKHRQVGPEVYGLCQWQPAVDKVDALWFMISVHIRECW